MTIDADSVALTTDTTGNYVASFTAGAGLTGDASGEGSTPTIVVGAGSGITVNADDIAVNQAFDFTFTGNNVLASSGTGDLTITTDADSNLLITSTAGNAVAFRITNSSSNAVVTIDTSGNELELGASGALAGGLVFYNSTNSNTLKLQAGTTSAGYTLTFPAAAPTTNNYCLQSSTAGNLSWSPCGGAGTTKTVTLAPEFPGAVLTGDGTSNTGTMTSDFCSGSSRQNINTSVCTVATESYNYYSWTANATNDYDVWIRWQVPSDFSSFTSTGSFNGWRTSTSDSVTMTFYNNSVSSCASASISGTVATWNNTSLSGLTGCSPSPGDVLNIRVQLSIGVNSEFARVGEITLIYNKL